MSTSMIMTTYNEASNIDGLLKDLCVQTYRPAEFLVVDGGSTDDTMAIVEAQKDNLASAGITLRLLNRPGVNIAAGRNIAVTEAAHDVICVSDAGCRLEKTWCERITRPLLEGKADLVGGFFKPVALTRFQRVLAGLTVASKPPKGFLPSSRSIAFRREAWEKAGAYPEWLPWGEDTLFNERCLETGARYVVAGDAIVHWEVRPSLPAALKQFYRYAWGDGRRLRASGSQLVNVLAVFGTALLAVFISPWWFLVYPLYVSGLLYKSWSELDSTDRFAAFGLAFLIRIWRAFGFSAGVLAQLIHGRRGQ